MPNKSGYICNRGEARGILPFYKTRWAEETEILMSEKISNPGRIQMMHPEQDRFQLSFDFVHACSVYAASWNNDDPAW